jgi:hypothetical protein
MDHSSSFDVGVTLKKNQKAEELPMLPEHSCKSKQQRSHRSSSQNELKLSGQQLKKDSSHLQLKYAKMLEELEKQSSESHFLENTKTC